MGICANCFKDVSETYLFCPFCGCPTGDKTVLETGNENEIDDKTKFETSSGFAYPDKTVLESEPGEDRTILPLFFAWLVFLGEDGKPMQDVRLSRQKSIIGKGAEADIHLEDNFASKLHALIHFEEGNFSLSDLGSTNHTWLNEKKIMIEKLTDGDRLRIGHRQMIFKQVRRNL